MQRHRSPRQHAQPVRRALPAEHTSSEKAIKHFVKRATRISTFRNASGALSQSKVALSGPATGSSRANTTQTASPVSTVALDFRLESFMFSVRTHSECMRTSKNDAAADMRSQLRKTLSRAQRNSLCESSLYARRHRGSVRLACWRGEWQWREM